jgi:hypothetical protein
MPPVEPLGIDAVDVPQTSRKIAVGGLNQQMIMVRHQAIGRNPETPEVACLPNGLKKRLVILGTPKNGFFPSSSIQDMIPSVGIFDAQRPRHGLTLYQKIK